MKKKIFACCFVILAISIFTINSFALAPPTITSTLQMNYSTPATSAEADKLFSLVTYQYQSGSFNGLDPLLLRISSSGEVQLFLADSRYAGYYVVDGTAVTIVGGGAQVVKAILTSEGFMIVSNFTGTAATYTGPSVIGYASGLEKLWTKCNLYTYGTTEGIVDTAYNLWSSYYWTLTRYEIEVEQAEQTGYQDGYTAGQIAGYQTGAEIGYGNGYNAGYQDGAEVGYEDGYEDGYADGVASGGGSSDRVVTATVTFANGEVPSPEGDNVILVKDGSFRFLGSDDLWTLLNSGYSIYSIDYQILESQLSSGSSIRFQIPDNIRRAFPSYSWPVVTVVDSRTESAELRVFLYTDSYDAGYQSGLQDGDMILEGIAGIATAPVESLRSALDFEIFGLDVGAVAIGCVAVALILIAWRFIRKIIPV